MSMPDLIAYLFDDPLDGIDFVCARRVLAEFSVGTHLGRSFPGCRRRSAAAEAAGPQRATHRLTKPQG
ncbi:hypothetical protein ACPW96_15110 [Micromonospora sp. DT81.3]|uniref:hypothetical protein n=1 Tax=Micromonospora sp. DT81.3 TaxID=3416523 RepID=UPI003CEDF525